MRNSQAQKKTLAVTGGALFLVAAAFLAYQSLFPDEETQVRRVVSGVLRTASSNDEGKDAGNPVVTARKALKIGESFVKDAEVSVQHRNDTRDLRGRADLQQAYAWLRTRYSPIEFGVDGRMGVLLDLDRLEATVTARVWVRGSSDEPKDETFDVTFELKKVDGDWMISRTEAKAGPNL